MLVTGATGAVGSRLARLACTAGWNVLGTFCQNRNRADALAGELAGARGTVRFEQVDLSDAEQTLGFISRLPQDYVPQALVHLAAPKLRITPVQGTEWQEYQRHIDGVLRAAVLLTGPLVKRMVRAGGGRVVAVLSAVVLGTPPKGFASYTVGKYALMGYLKCVAAEYAGRGISVNMLSPGAMNTELLSELPELMRDQMKSSMPGQKWVDPESVARAVFWLGSEAGSEMTGCNLPMTGGLTF